MDKAEKKIELIKWLTKLQDESVLEKLEDLKMQSQVKDYGSSKMKPMSVQEYELLLYKAAEDVRNGRITSQEDIEKEFGIQK